MRDIELMEAYLNDRLSADEREDFRQRLLLEPFLYEKMQQQKQILQLVQQRGRRQLRRELTQLHAELFGSAGNRNWQNRILRWFR